MYTTSQLYDEFLAAKSAAGAAQSTMRTFRYRLAHFVDWLGNRKIDRTAIRAYFTHLSKTRNNPLTINGYMQNVSAFCTWLVAEGEIEINPCANIRQKLPKRRPASYNRDHIRKILDIANLRERALVLVLLDTGLRVSELVQLRRDSFDYRGHFSIVGKGNKERSGWLSPYAHNIVRAYLATRYDRNPALWLSHYKKPATAKVVHGVIDRLAKRAGIRDQVRRLVHSFRATFAKNWRKNQGDLASLAEILGHSTLTMAQYYSQLADEELGELKNKVNPLAASLDEAS